MIWVIETGSWWNYSDYNNLKCMKMYKIISHITLQT